MPVKFLKGNNFLAAVRKHLLIKEIEGGRRKIAPENLNDPALRKSRQAKKQ